MPRPRLRRLAVASLSLAALVAPASASASDTACTRFAARTGSDVNPGTLIAPKLTVQALVNTLAPGDAGCLRAGTYAETSNGYSARFATGGTTAAPITLRSYPGERAHVVGIVDVTDTAAAVHIADLDIEGPGTSNTVKVYAPDVVIEGNTITNEHRGLSCMMLGSNSGAGQALRVIVRRNLFRACGSPANTNKDHAIYAANVQSGEITDNVITDPSAWAIQLYPNAHDTRFAHNVVDGGSSVRGGVVFGGDTSYTSTGNLVEDNVLSYAATYGLTSSWGGVVGSDNVARDNCVYGAKLGALGAVVGFANFDVLQADPGFVDRAGGDYRMAPASPCLAVVGYDTARLLAGESGGAAVDPAATPTPEATVSPTPTATAAAAPDPTVAPEPSATPIATVTADTTPTVNAAPAVALTAPSAGSTYGSVLGFAATASDDMAVAKVEFYVDGKLVATDPGAPYAASWRVPRKQRGRHSVIARAYDTAGLSSSTAPVTVSAG